MIQRPRWARNCQSLPRLKISPSASFLAFTMMEASFVEKKKWKNWVPNPNKSMNMVPKQVWTLQLIIMVEQSLEAIEPCSYGQWAKITTTYRKSNRSLAKVAVESHPKTSSQWCLHSKFCTKSSNRNNSNHLNRIRSILLLRLRKRRRQWTITVVPILMQ